MTPEAILRRLTREHPAACSLQLSDRLISELLALAAAKRAAAVALHLGEHSSRNLRDEQARLGEARGHEDAAFRELNRRFADRQWRPDAEDGTSRFSGMPGLDRVSMRG